MSYRPFTNYEHFIYLSRYSKWVEELNRRETWEETVDRLVTYYQDRTRASKASIPWAELRQAILNRDVMPSMRCMMAAGPAMEANDIAAYNCAFHEIDSLESFGETLYILMNGTGVGFSVTEASISNLPIIQEMKDVEPLKYTVPDSKDGWRSSVDLAMLSAHNGVSIEFDYSLIRPPGARLRTFGGRASGPEPLKDLHKFIDLVASTSRGCRLNSIDVHDLICKIAEVVVVGGVRRSALVSLSDLNDQDMAQAKSGDWWTNNGQRALANNSAIYTEKPTEAQFFHEWDNLEASGSGERGVFNLKAANLKCREIKRKELIAGGNPCMEILLRNGQFCNLTEVIIRPEDSERALLRKIHIATILGTIQSSFTNIKGLRSKWLENTMEERLLGVSMTGIVDNALTNGTHGTEALEQFLTRARENAILTNDDYAQRLDIPASAAITAIKPSGTVSQLCGTSSGIHPAHSEKYIRRVRNDVKDPISQLLIDQGVPYELDVHNPLTYVFSFPISREGSITRDDWTAIEFLEFWKTYYDFYTDHNPSVTVSVKDHEWAEVGQWVYDNFDSVCGLSFLPHSEHTYVQAPYESVDILPAEKTIDFSKMHEYESEDHTTGSQELACVAGLCSL